MADLKDDIAMYYGWRASIEQHELPPGLVREKKIFSARELYRKLSASTPRSERLEPDPVEDEKKRAKVPQNREVELINKWKEVDTAHDELTKIRQQYSEKMKDFQRRWRKVEAGQLEVKQNLVKFNNFVREKQGKVMGGLDRVRQEQKIQEEKADEVVRLQKKRVKYEDARKLMESAVEEKKIFSNYLQAVVDIVPDIYPDIRRLMERCQALVATRDKLQKRLDQIELDREEESRSLKKFCEHRMEKTLDYNVRLAELQQNAAKLAARTLERKTIFDNIQHQSKEKKLLISNIKLAIANMHRYVQKQAVLLPGDSKDDKAADKNISGQLAAIISHIEDLQVVNERVNKSDNESGYLAPLPSEHSNLRIDY